MTDKIKATILGPSPGTLMPPGAQVGVCFTAVAVTEATSPPFLNRYRFARMVAPAPLLTALFAMLSERTVPRLRLTFPDGGATVTLEQPWLISGGVIAHAEGMTAVDDVELSALVAPQPPQPPSTTTTTSPRETSTMRNTPRRPGDQTRAQRAIRWDDKQLAAARIDKQRLVALVAKLEQCSQELLALGLHVYGESGDGYLIHTSRPEHRDSDGKADYGAIVATVGFGFDGGGW